MASFLSALCLGDPEGCVLTASTDLCWWSLMPQPAAAPRDSESDFSPSFTCLPWVVLVPSALSGQETRSLSSFPRAQPTLAFRPDLGETKGNDNVDKNASGCCQCDGSWSPEVTARPGRLGQTLSFFGCPQPDIFSCPCWTCFWERPHNLQSSSTPFSGAQLKTKD